MGDGGIGYGGGDPDDPQVAQDFGEAMEAFWEYVERRGGGGNNISEAGIQRGPVWDKGEKTVYKGVERIIVDKGKQKKHMQVGLGTEGVREGEMARRIQRHMLGELGVLPPSRPDRFVLAGKHSRSVDHEERPKRCVEINEIDRVQRARSMFGILGADVTTNIDVGSREIGGLYEAAIQRLQRCHREGSGAAAATERKLRVARDLLMSIDEQRRIRGEWQRQQVTCTLRCPVDLEALQKFLDDGAVAPASDIKGTAYDMAAGLMEAAVATQGRWGYVPHDTTTQRWERCFGMQV